MAVYNTSAKVSNRMCTALGRLCVEFSVLEWNVERTIWAIQGHDRKVGRTKTVGMMTRRKVKTMRNVAVGKFGEKSAAGKHYLGIIDELEEIRFWRNLFVHGLWGKGIAKGERRSWYVLTYFENPGGTSAEAKLTDITQLTEYIREVIEKLRKASFTHLGTKLP
ncbi:hypothetical protein [Dongia sp.]|uniref:hypothetical protein n=1 Tax=Dongia sp. TaxID=1977262 RepID=UPI0037536361